MAGVVAYFKMSKKILTLVGVLLMMGSVLSFYNKSYDGYTFILPDIVKDGTRSIQLELSFTDAQQWCKAKVAGSTLATIHNQFVQRNIADFIARALQKDKLLSSYRIRLNGKFHITNAWRWINGHPKASDITVHEQNDDPNYSFKARLIGKNFSIHSDEIKMGTFICEYPGNSKQCALLLNGRCYQMRRFWLNWYEAMNKCLDERGDLASFETLSDANINASLKNLSLFSNEDYGIGLQKNEWRWEDTGSAIKYTKWQVQPTFKGNTGCLCLTQYYLWNWIECDCSKQFTFICMLKDISDSPTQGTSTSTDTPDSSIQETSTSNETTKFVILAVACAVIFVVIIIIAAALIAKKRRNSDAPRALRSSGYVTPKYTVTESSTDFPVYEEIIQNPKETNIHASDTTYASVVRKVAAKTEEEEKHPVNSIVYAELDLTSKE